MATVRKFKFALAILSLNGKAILDAAVKYAAQIGARLSPARVTELQGYLQSVTDGVAVQKGKSGDVGDLTAEQNRLLKEVNGHLAEARKFAKRAFPGQTVKLHEQFQVGEADTAHKKRDLASIVERARIVLASCRNAANATALADKGWLAADSDALETAITALADTDETQETGKGERKGDTEAVTIAANNLYDGLLDIQVIAGKVFPVATPGNVAIRDEFKLGTFPPKDQGGKDKKPNGPTPPAPQPPQ